MGDKCLVVDIIEYMYASTCLSMTQHAIEFNEIETLTTCSHWPLHVCAHQSLRNSTLADKRAACKAAVRAGAQFLGQKKKTVLSVTTENIKRSRWDTCHLQPTKKQLSVTTENNTEQIAWSTISAQFGGTVDHHNGGSSTGPPVDEDVRVPVSARASIVHTC